MILVVLLAITIGIRARGVAEMSIGMAASSDWKIEGPGLIAGFAEGTIRMKSKSLV